MNRIAIASFRPKTLRLIDIQFDINGAVGIVFDGVLVYVRATSSGLAITCGTDLPRRRLAPQRASTNAHGEITMTLKLARTADRSDQ